MRRGWSTSHEDGGWSTARCPRPGKLTHTLPDSPGCVDKRGFSGGEASCAAQPPAAFSSPAPGPPGGPVPSRVSPLFLQEIKGRGQTSRRFTWHLGLWLPRRWWLLSWPKRSAATRRLLEVEPTFWGKFKGKNRCPRGWHSAAGKAAGRREQEPPWMDFPITLCAYKAPLHHLVSPGCFRGRVSLPPPLHLPLPKRKRE